MLLYCAPMQKTLNICFFFFVFSFSDYAYAIELAMPIKCDYGKDCFIQNYFDNDSGKNWHDFNCKKMSYDGHGGTDFAILDFSMMKKGVDVLAAADGIVKDKRDGEEDNGIVKKDMDCGNGIVLKHNDGWETQYCHMRKYSIIVLENQKIKKGQKLGEVGFSGNTEFPHLHITVRKNGKKIDPFTGYSETAECRKNRNSLWEKEPEYIETGFINMFFTSAVPEMEGAREGKYREERINHDAPALVAWAEIFGIQENDKLLMRIISPNGTEFVKALPEMTKNKARYFQMIGKKNRTKNLQKGEYKVILTLERNGNIILSKEKTVQVE